MWLTWKHARKFARLGVHARFPIPDLHVEGHVEMGDHCRLRNNVTLRARDGGRIIFGNRCGCSWGCLVDARSVIRIGNYSAVAEYSVLCDSVVPLLGNEAAPCDAVRAARPITIGDNCFIGSACYIGPGVTVHDSAIIAHHSIVLEDVPPLEIWGGAPARKIGHRTEGIPEERMREIREMIEQHGIAADRYRDE